MGGGFKHYVCYGIRLCVTDFPSQEKQKCIFRIADDDTWCNETHFCVIFMRFKSQQKIYKERKENRQTVIQLQQLKRKARVSEHRVNRTGLDTEESVKQLCGHVPRLRCFCSLSWIQGKCFILRVALFEEVIVRYLMMSLKDDK